MKMQDEVVPLYYKTALGSIIEVAGYKEWVRLSLEGDLLVDQQGLWAPALSFFLKAKSSRFISTSYKSKIIQNKKLKSVTENILNQHALLWL